MATTAMPDRAAAPENARPAGEPTVQAIIAAARRPQPAPARGAWLCGGASALLWSLSFFPANWGPLAFLAPVPLLLLVRVEERPRRTYLAVYVTWLAATLAAISWMAANGPMVPAWLALSFYMALYAPAFLLACRAAVHRLNVPLAVAAPVVWTGLEFLRAHLMTGFPWYFLGHTQWRWTTLIQVSDLVGAYGVSFVAMAAAAAVAVCVPEGVFSRLRLLPVRDGVVSPAPTASQRQRFGSVAFALALLAAALGYGAVRMSGEHFSPGPRVALIQGNFPSRLSGNPAPGEFWHMYNRLTAAAVQYQPDFVVWPESAFRWPLFEATEDMTDKDLAPIVRQKYRGQVTVGEWRAQAADAKEILGDLATQANAAMLIGLSAEVADKGHGLRRYNSAAFAVPEIGLAGRYDKRHRVIFGEYVPLRNVFPFLRAFSPYTDSFSIDPGEGPKTFRHAGHSISPLICYEDTVPDLVRDVVAAAEANGGKGIDVLVNVTNDGWFDRSSEQEQHLVTSLFRAVETRTPLVRAANTGISAVFDGDGRLVEPVAFLDGETRAPTSMTDRSGRLKKDLHAALVADVPLDARTAPYVRTGDWFAGLCGAASLFCLGWTLLPRRRFP
ncbi:MAG TPA: apolipoprotein N-acyltransferase [Planctomycetaceae bacterium]